MKPISISLITGFLGSGKTTLISRLLSDPVLAGTIVIVNDVAQMGFDDALLGEGAEEVLLLSNGCICCSIDEDLCLTLHNLLRRYRVGELPLFSHVVIETTGIADPIPIMRSIAANSILGRFYRLDRVIVTVDGVYGSSQLTNHLEATTQVAVADFIVITKSADLDPAILGDLMSRVSRINATAELRTATIPLTARQMLARTQFSGVQAISAQVPHGSSAHKSREPLQHHISVACLSADRRIVWDKLVTWIEELSSELGENLLRIKGIVALAGHDAPVFINGVQDTFYAPILLPQRFAPGDVSRMVVIARNVDLPRISNCFHAAVFA